MDSPRICAVRFFTIVVGIVIELARESVFSELLCPGNSIVISLIIGALQNDLKNERMTFESKGLKFNLR